MLLLATHTTVMDLPATATQLEPGEQVFLLSTGSTCSQGIAAFLMVLETLAITKLCATKPALLGSVHTTTVLARSCSLSCCAKFHRLVLSACANLSYAYC